MFRFSGRRLHGWQGFALCAAAWIALRGGLDAHPWNSNPQPLLDGASPITADAGSPLAWDSSERVLYFIDFGALACAWWNGTTFQTGFPKISESPNPEGGLAVDSGLHYLYFLTAAGQPVCVHLVAGQRVATVMGAETLGKLLAVDEKHHAVFAYDLDAGGIRQYQLDAKQNAWTSQIIASGLGQPGDAGAFDPILGTLYTTHQTADPSIPRLAGIAPMPDPSGLGLLPPWPLVAATWNGAQWSSQVLAETGVPQQPAVRPGNHQVLFAMRDDLTGIYWYQPPAGKTPESVGTAFGWAGQETYVDDDSYPIGAPQYPWTTWSTGGVIDFYSSSGLGYPALFFPSNSLTPPITIVPYYEPIWQDTPVAPRLSQFRAIINPVQMRLVENRQSASGEIIRQQTGTALAGYLYKDAKGVLTTSLVGGMILFPVLDATFDPTNPPANFSALSSTASGSYYFTTSPSQLASVAIPPSDSLNPNSPFVPTELRLPTDVSLLTFGHCYASKAQNQRGGRFQDYSAAATSLAVPSGLAVDPVTGAQFYTQAPVNTSVSSASNASAEAPPFSAFTSAPEPKYPLPANEQVWIVMVY